MACAYVNVPSVLLDCLCGRSHTNKLPESELHLGLVWGTATHELCFHFQVLKLEVENFFLQGLFEPRAPLLVGAQVRDGEAHCEAQHWGVDSQRHVTVGGCMAVIKENLCKSLMLCNDLKEK